MQTQEEKRAKVDKIIEYFKTQFKIELVEMQNERDEFFMLTDKPNGLMITTGLDNKQDGISVNLLGDPGILTWIVYNCIKEFDFTVYEPFIPTVTGKLEFGVDAYAIKDAYEKHFKESTHFPDAKDVMKGIPIEETGEILGAEEPKSIIKNSIIEPVLGAEEVGKIIIP